MGCRAQVLIKDTGVYLYDHLGAADGKILEVVRDVLRRGERWQDPEYLAAILFRHMIKGDLDGTTQFGVGTNLHGDIQLLVTVDCSSKSISAEEHCFADGRGEDRRKRLQKNPRQCSFSEFAEGGTAAFRPVSV